MAGVAFFRPTTSRRRGPAVRDRTGGCGCGRADSLPPIPGGTGLSGPLPRPLARIDASTSTIGMMTFVVLSAYAIGSVPFALLFARYWGAVDLRRVGVGTWAPPTCCVPR